MCSSELGFHRGALGLPWMGIELCTPWQLPPDKHWAFQQQLLEDSLWLGQPQHRWSWWAFFFNIILKSVYIYGAHIMLWARCGGFWQVPALEEHLGQGGASRVTAQGNQVPWATGRVLLSLGRTSGKGKDQAGIWTWHPEPCFLPSPTPSSIR